MGTVIIWRGAAYVFKGLDSEKALAAFFNDWHPSARMDQVIIYPIRGMAG